MQKPTKIHYKIQIFGFDDLNPKYTKKRENCYIQKQKFNFFVHKSPPKYQFTAKKPASGSLFAIICTWPECRIFVSAPSGKLSSRRYLFSSFIEFGQYSSSVTAGIETLALL